MLKKNKILKTLISIAFCFAFFAASVFGLIEKKQVLAKAADQVSTPNIYEDEPTNWSHEDGVLSLNGVNWIGVLNLQMATEFALENSSINTIVGEEGTAIVLIEEITVNGAGKLILGTKDKAVDTLINFDDGDNVVFTGTCMVQVGGTGALVERETPLTADTLENVNYIEITTADYVETGSPEGGEPEGGDPEGSEPEGSEPSGDEPSITAIESIVTLNYNNLSNGKYDISTMFNPVNCGELTLAYYLVSDDGQTETSLASEEYEITAAGTYIFKVKALNGEDTSLAECTATLVIEKANVSVSLAFGKWEYGDDPTPQLTGAVPNDAVVTYEYFLDANHNNPVTENDGIPTEIGIYYAVVNVAATPTTNAATAEASFEIVRKTITIIWSANSYTYNGQVQVVTASYEVGGDSVELAVSIDKEFKDAQSYVATASFKNGETNYNLPDNPTNSYTINKRAITVQISNKTSVYQEQLRGLTAGVISGSIMEGDNPYTLSTTANKDVMGAYDIVGTPTDENYSVSFIKGKYIVKNKITSLSIDNWTYGETPKTPEVTAYYGADQVVYTYTSTGGYNSNIAPTEPGTYFVKAEINLPEEYYYDYKTTNFTIHHLVVDIPQGDQTTYTYDGQYKIYNIVGQNEYYTVNGAIQSEAGTYQVKVTLKDTSHYKWYGTTVSTLEYTFVINKLKVEKPAKDTRVFKHSGFNLIYNISESSYYNVSGNIQSETGTHDVIIELKDKKNTCWADGSVKDLHYEFVIRGSNITSSNTTNPDGESLSNNPVTIISSDGNGIDPNVSLNVKVSDNKNKNQIENTKIKLKEYLEKYDAIHTIYDVKLLNGQTEVQPDGTITMKMMVPEELKDMNFKLYHIHTDNLGNVSVEEVACSASSQGFVTIQVDKLSDFVFVYKQSSLKGLIITFACVCAGLAVLLALQLWIFFKNKAKKAASTSLALAPAMFVGGEVAWSVVFGILSVVLLAGNIVILILLLRRRKNKLEKSQTDVDTIELSDNSEQQKGRDEVKPKAETKEKKETRRKEKGKRKKERKAKNDEIKSKRRNVLSL